MSQPAASTVVDCPLTSQPGEHLADRTPDGGFHCSICGGGGNRSLLVFLTIHQLRTAFGTPLGASVSNRQGTLRVSCPGCRGADTCAYSRHQGRVSCECGFEAGLREFEEALTLQTDKYFAEFPGLVDGSWFKAAVRLADDLLKIGNSSTVVERYVKAYGRAVAPPLAEWQVNEALEIAAKRELARRGGDPALKRGTG